MATNHTVFQNVALAISRYAQEAWTEEKRINSTGMVSSDANISVEGEGFIGQLRWYKPTITTINNASLTDSTDGTRSTISTDIASYIKNLRTQGMQQVNMQEVISRQDALAKAAGAFAMNRAQDEHNSVLSVLKGVAAAEAAVGEGIVDFDTVPSGSIGAYVDVNALGAFGAAATGSSDARKLVDATVSGAAQGERLYRAMGMAFKDYEPDYAYLMVTPEVYADLRGANLIDEDRVRDGNLDFQTIFGGKFRLVLSRANQGDQSAATDVNAQSTKTTLLVKPGSIFFTEIPTPMPTEIDRDAAAYKGGGTTDVWYRYGFVTHPKGYSWAGSTTDFSTNTTLAAAASWERKLDPLNLGILPIFHS